MNQLVGVDKKGQPIVILILEPGNLHKLKEGLPIEVRIDDLFPDGIPQKLNLAIMHSETPVRDSRELAKLSEITLDERSAITKTKRPHCPECRSSIEQLGVWKNESPLAITFCPMCGCTLGMIPNEVAKTLKGC